MRVNVEVNGRGQSADVADNTLLVDFVRNNLNLTGTHVGCDTSQCGACTVLLDGQPVKACTLLAAQAEGKKVTTIEGLAPVDAATGLQPLHPMQTAFHECHALQCGFCTPGMIMAAVAIAGRNATLDEATVRHELDGNLCRCTGYHNIVRAVLKGAAAMGSNRT